MNNTLGAYLEQEIMSASPLELVCILYQAAIMEVRDARRHLAAGDISARCAAISKACDITSELLAALDPDAGGEVAQSLSSLYTYILSRLFQANLKKEDAPLAEVLGLLSTLSEGWQATVEAKRRETSVTPQAGNSHYFESQTAESAAQSWSF